MFFFTELFKLVVSERLGLAQPDRICGLLFRLTNPLPQNFHKNFDINREIIRVCKVMAELGITKIKITGGEPLVRSRIPELIYQIKEISGIEKVTLTTNGILLKGQMKALAESGVHWIVSSPPFS